MNRPTLQTGFTLIELMVGMVVGLIVLSGVLFSFLTMVRSSLQIERMANLEIETSVLTDRIIGEIRRSGYWYQLPTNIASGADSPYLGNSTSGEFDIYVDSGQKCVLYSYDQNDNKEIEAEERRGFLAFSNSLYYLASAASLSSSLCSSNTGWIQLNNPEISVIETTDFQFSETCSDTTSAADCSLSEDRVEIRNVGLSYVARHIEDTSVKVIQKSSVTIRNNRVYE